MRLRTGSAGTHSLDLWWEDEEVSLMAQRAATRIDVSLQSGMRFEAFNDDAISVMLDAAPKYGGGGTGFSPMQMLLIGLGGCTGMDVISILRKKRQDVTGYRIEVTGVQAEEHPRTFTDISLNHVLTGNNLSEEAIRDSIELSESKYCGALAMLEKAAHISSTYEIQPAPPED
jgi:putative redox protein